MSKLNENEDSDDEFEDIDDLEKSNDTENDSLIVKLPLDKKEAQINDFEDIKLNLVEDVRISLFSFDLSSLPNDDFLLSFAEFEKKLKPIIKSKSQERFEKLKPHKKLSNHENNGDIPNIYEQSVIPLILSTIHVLDSSFSLHISDNIIENIMSEKKKINSKEQIIKNTIPDPPKDITEVKMDEINIQEQEIYKNPQINGTSEVLVDQNDFEFEVLENIQDSLMIEMVDVFGNFNVNSKDEFQENPVNENYITNKINHEKYNQWKNIITMKEILNYFKDNNMNDMNIIIKYNEPMNKSTIGVLKNEVKKLEKEKLEMDMAIKEHLEKYKEFQMDQNVKILDLENNYKQKLYKVEMSLKKKEDDIKMLVKQNMEKKEYLRALVGSEDEGGISMRFRKLIENVKKEFDIKLNEMKAEVKKERESNLSVREMNAKLMRDHEDVGQKSKEIFLSSQRIVNFNNELTKSNLKLTKAHSDLIKIHSDLIKSNEDLKESNENIRNEIILIRRSNLSLIEENKKMWKGNEELKTLHFTQSNHIMEMLKFNNKFLEEKKKLNEQIGSLQHDLNILKSFLPKETLLLFVNKKKKKKKKDKKYQEEIKFENTKNNPFFKTM